MPPFVSTAGFLLLLTCVFEIYAKHVGKKRGIKLTSATVRPDMATPISSWSALLFGLQGRFPIFFFCALTLAFPEQLASSSLGAAFCAGAAMYLGVKILARTTTLQNPRPLFALDTLLYLAPAVFYSLSAAAWLVI